MQSKAKLIEKVAFLILLFSAVLIPTVSAQPKASDYFATAKVINAAISPDGLRVIRLENEDDSQILVLQDVASNKLTKLLSLAEFTKDEANISAITWQDNQRLLAQFSVTKKGVEDLLDTRRRQFLLSIELPINDIPLVIKSVRTSGWLVNSLPAEADAFLYAKSGIYSKVYRLQPSLLSPHKKRLGKLSKKDGGQFKSKNEIVSVEGYAFRWFFDAKGVAKAVLHYDRKDGLTLSQIGSAGVTEKLKSWPKDDKSESDKSKKIKNTKHLY